MIDYLITRGPYYLFVVLITAGLYMLIARRSYLKMMAGLYLFQSSIILIYVLLAARRGGTVPILPDNDPTAIIINPLPHALMLTAIVVGVATLGVGLAIMRRMHVEEGSIEEDDDRLTPTSPRDPAEGGR